MDVVTVTVDVRLSDADDVPDDDGLAAGERVAVAVVVRVTDDVALVVAVLVLVSDTVVVAVLDGEVDRDGDGDAVNVVVPEVDRVGEIVGECVGDGVVVHVVDADTVSLLLGDCDGDGDGNMTAQQSRQMCTQTGWGNRARTHEGLTGSPPSSF